MLFMESAVCVKSKGIRAVVYLKIPFTFWGEYAMLNYVKCIVNYVVIVQIATKVEAIGMLINVV